MIRLLKALFGRGGEQVHPREAASRCRHGAVLIDVRDAGEYASGHAPQALHLPVERIRMQGPTALDGLGVAPTGEVLLVCQSGMRSRIAQSVLHGADPRRRYTNVAGGMSAWAASGLPVERGPAKPFPETLR